MADNDILARAEMRVVKNGDGTIGFEGCVDGQGAWVLAAATNLVINIAKSAGVDPVGLCGLLSLMVMGMPAPDVSTTIDLTRNIKEGGEG